MDGVHIKIQETSPFNKTWNSHKLGGAVVAYELATCIQTGDIVSFNGPFPAGGCPDIKNFRNKIKKKLLSWEKVLADQGYRGERKVITVRDAKDEQNSYAMACARARHETINRRIKTWKALKKEFRHDRNDHHYFFRSAIVMEQIKIENGNPPFKITNYIDLIRIK